MEKLRKLVEDGRFCDICKVVLSGAQNAREHMNGRKHQMKAGMASNQVSVAHRSVFLRQLPPMTNEMQVSDAMNRFGPISQSYVDRRNGKYAIVEFADAVSQTKALAAGFVHINGSKIKIIQRQINPHLSNISFKQAFFKEPFEFNKLYDDTMKILQTLPNVDAQLKQFMKMVPLPKHFLNYRRQALEDIQQLLEKFYPSCSLIIYGSTVNGFGFNHCDMDITISIPEVGDLGDIERLDKAPPVKSVEDRKVSLQQLRTLSVRETVRFVHMVLRKKCPHVANVIFIPSVRCPIVRFAHKGLRIYCDLSVEKKIGIRNSKLLHFLGNLDKRICMLVLILRFWAKAHSIIGSGSTRITSYAFTWLVLFYLQNIEPPLIPTIEQLQNLSDEPIIVESYNTAFCEDRVKLPKIKNTDDLMTLLRGFFFYYLHIDLSQMAVCPRNRELIQKNYLKEQLVIHGNFKTSCLCVQDPFELARNITGNVTPSSLVELMEGLQEGEKIVTNAEFNLWPGLALLFEHHPKPKETKKTKALKRTLSQMSSTSDLNFNIRLTEMFYSDGQTTEDILTKLSQTLIAILEFGLLMDCIIIKSILKIKTATEEIVLSDSETVKSLSDNAIETSSVELILEECGPDQPPSKRAKLSNDVENQSVEPEPEKLSKRFLAQIQCSVVHRVWNGRRKIKVQNPGQGHLEKEREISQIVIQKSGEPSKPLFDLNIILTEHHTNGVTLLDVCLESVEAVREFGSVASFLLAYLPKTIKIILFGNDQP